MQSRAASLFMPPIGMFVAETEARFDFVDSRLDSVEVDFHPLEPTTADKS